jgi:hypothetical protein
MSALGLTFFGESLELNLAALTKVTMDRVRTHQGYQFSSAFVETRRT